MDEKLNRQLMTQDNTLQFRGFAMIMVVLSHYAEWWGWFMPLEGNGAFLQSVLTRLGVYGVDLFFLFSGYALVKSWSGNGERVTWQFVVKRIKGIYLPYLIVAGSIHLCSGGFEDVADVFKFLIGYDFWFMTVIFAFNIAFLVIYRVFGRFKAVRVISFCAFTAIFSRMLYIKEMQDFWYISNITFAIGIIVGEYEAGISKAIKKCREPLLIILILAMGLAAWSGMWPSEAMQAATEGTRTGYKILATVIWSLLIMLLMMQCSRQNKVLAFLGSCSLYIYLSHTFIFMYIINHWEFSYITNFVLAAIVTVFVSWGLSQLIAWLLERLDTLFMKSKGGANGKGV